jgi:hypothetical protein
VEIVQLKKLRQEQGKTPAKSAHKNMYIDSEKGQGCGCESRGDERHAWLKIGFTAKLVSPFGFAKLYAKRVLLFCETNWPFRKISCFVKQLVSHVLLFLIQNETACFACFAILFTKF